MPEADDPYLLPNGTLRNKLGITNPEALARAENGFVTARTSELSERLPRAPFTFETLRGIHRSLFQDVYDWAGEARTTPLAKREYDSPASPVQRFASPVRIAAEAEAIFRRLESDGFFTGSTRAEFAARATELFADLNHLHFAREGNGRASRLLIGAIGKSAGHTPNFDFITRERMISISIDANKGDTAGVRRMFDEILEPAQIEAVRKAVGFLRTSSRIAWNDVYIATTRAGRDYAGTLAGRAGADCLIRAVLPRGDPVLFVGAAADLPANATAGSAVSFRSKHFQPSEGPKPVAASAVTQSTPATAPAQTKPFDPCNIAGEKNPDRITGLEYRLFAKNVGRALENLQSLKRIGYDDILATNRILFGALYPWAGQDRAALAPGIAIGKGGHTDLFAHPRDVRRAAEHGLDLSRDKKTMRERPGEIFGLLAYAHPFLETNGRTLMTVHADLSRRANFHIDWPRIGKQDFLTALTAELRQPGSALDSLLAPQVKPGPMPLLVAGNALRINPDLNPSGPAKKAASPGPSPSPGF